MNTIQIFQSPDFGQIRTATDEKGEPLFCLTDVCNALDLRAPDVKRRLDDDVVSTHTVKDSLGRNNKMSFVNEDGLYDVILDSRKAEARRFRKWVTSVVLPQIRKTGGYLPLTVNSLLTPLNPLVFEGQKPKEGSLTDSEIMARALMIAQKTIELKNGLLEAQRPKVLFAEAVTACDDSILIRDLAKLITQNGVTIGQGRLFYWLRLHGYLFKNETRPIQKWVEKGLFEVCVTTYEVGGKTFEKLQTRVTGKGQQYFLNGFLTGRFCAENGRFK